LVKVAAEPSIGSLIVLNLTLLGSESMPAGRGGGFLGGAVVGSALPAAEAEPISPAGEAGALLPLNALSRNRSRERFPGFLWIRSRSLTPGRRAAAASRDRVPSSRFFTRW